MNLRAITYSFHIRTHVAIIVKKTQSNFNYDLLLAIHIERRLKNLSYDKRIKE